MSQVWKVTVEDGVTVVRILSRPSYADLQAALDEVVQNYNFEYRLWDFSGDQFNLSLDDIKAMAEYGKSMVDSESTRVAIVAPHDVDFGSFRLFEVYRKKDNRTAVRVFRTKPEALEWLKNTASTST